MECAIPLISISEDDNSFEVNEEAIALLSTINKKICIVAVAGLYRTGKSSLLNWLAGRSKGFTVGPTINRCTRGIWLWGEPLSCTTENGEQCACIILDTEGLGGVESNLKYDTRIFSLVILLCSTLVYNSLGSIDENAISNLSLVTQLSENIRLTNKSNDEGGENDDALNFYKVFPSFIWVVRDFALDLEDEEGYEITPTQYLNSALEQNPGYDKQTMERNRIRHMLTSFFPDRECVTLVRPISDEAALQQVDDLDYNDLREEFREGITGLKNSIFQNARLKSIDGKTLTGPMFGGLVRCYVKAINDGAVPTISTAWEGVSQQESSQAKDNSMELYFSVMRSSILDKSFPVEDRELIEMHKKASGEALHFYHQRAVGPAAKGLAKELEQELEKELLKSELENYKSSDDFCNNLLSELYSSIIRIKLHQEKSENGVCAYALDMQMFKRDWDDLMELYMQKARGPSKWKILSDNLKAKFVECSNVIVSSVIGDYESKLSKLNEDKQETAKRLSTLDAEFHVLQNSTNETDARNKELEEKLVEMEVDHKSRKALYAELSSEHSALLEKYDEEKDMRIRNEAKIEKNTKRLDELDKYETSYFELTHEREELKMRIKELEEEVNVLKQKKKKGKCTIS